MSHRCDQYESSPISVLATDSTDFEGIITDGLYADPFTEVAATPARSLKFKNAGW